MMNSIHVGRRITLLFYSKAIHFAMQDILSIISRKSPLFWQDILIFYDIPRRKARTMPPRLALWVIFLSQITKSRSPSGGPAAIHFMTIFERVMEPL